ncbi:MAG: Lrp/AsnC ligand binding domain-containing protein [Chloroflexota bacterium]|nr:Lrp/AsnC ligand binding domain-containing protein [Chloroflexota bacterium]MDE2857114.1 Lrp/AsnC ligand binding domain-containing protein [Chloroflexota bacterium]
MPAAYVLIHLNISVDFADSLRDIRALDGVERADLVVGPDDCIAYVEAEDNAKLMNTIRAMRNVNGVGKTDTRSIAEI